MALIAVNCQRELHTGTATGLIARQITELTLVQSVLAATAITAKTAAPMLDTVPKNVIAIAPLLL